VTDNIVNSYTTTGYSLSAGDSVYVTSAGSIYIPGGDAIDSETLGSAVDITVLGAIYAGAGGLAMNIRDGAFITLGRDAFVYGFDAIQAYNNSSINNAGSIVGAAAGILTETGTFDINNTGSISGGGNESGAFQAGILLYTGGQSGTIVNSGTISGINGSGVYVPYDDDVTVDIENSGTIQASGTGRYSMLLGSGDDKIVNGGKVIGDAALGSGDDDFDGRGGFMSGTVYGQAGDDTLYGSDTGADVLDGGTGYDYLNGGGGSDTAYYFDASSPDGVIGLTVSLTDPTQNTGDAEGDVYVSIENLGGTAYNDSLTGDANANTINGYGGDDVISGATGADTMIGGSGDDTYYVDNVGDSVIEKVDGGNDRIISSVSYSLHGRYVETLTLSGTANINATGNDLANTLNGNTGNNVLDGKGGVDTMSGGLGDDTYYVDDSNDNVVETSTTGGNDAVFSSVTYNLKGRYVETLTLTGTADINATGNNSINTLVGNSGANILDGQGGNDTLTGGGGADIFAFDTALSATTNVDTITDFSVGTDLIQLDKAIFTALGADGALAASAFGLGTSATTSSQRILYNSATGDIFYDKDGTGSAAAVKFAHVAVGTALTASSFSIT
jgi:hypothetical protein